MKLAQTPEENTNRRITLNLVRKRQLIPTVFFFLARQSPVGHGPLIHEIYRSHTTTHHNRQDSCGRVISPSQSPLPDNTQHSQQTDIHAPPVGFEPTISAGERLQIYALDRAATGTGNSNPVYEITITTNLITNRPSMMIFCNNISQFQNFMLVVTDKEN